MNTSVLTADLVVLIHAAYVAFVIVGMAMILVGAARGWRWVRNFWFRTAHLASIVFVFAEAVVGISCPLTVMENMLRVQGGEGAYPGDFVPYWTHRLIFYDWPAGVFFALYSGFAIAVAAAFVAIPPVFPWYARKA